jgi:hypothetical protein
MSYSHPDDRNLTNLHKAMTYNSEVQPAIRTIVTNDTGSPIPVSLGGNDLVITGSVTIPGIVNVASSTDNPVHVHLTEVGTSGILTVPWLPIEGNVYIDGGNVNVRVTGGNVTVAQGTMPWVVTGNTNVVVTSIPSVTLSSNAVTVSGNVSIANQPTVNIGTMPSIAGNVSATIAGTPTVAFSATATDAFGRMRVSNPYTLFDGALRYRDDEFKWDQVDTGAGVSVFIPNESSILMTVAGNGDSAVRQSKQVFSYQPGKSLLSMITFVMNTPTAGLRQRVGYFGAQNGVYFEVDGTAINLVIRKYTSGTVDDTSEKISQTIWNGDKLNGTGASGITLDVSKSQIFWCDVEWLGVGSVRAGFVINGVFIICHTFHHANILDKVYMTTASLPVRYELTSTGTAGTMRAICSTVISEGGYSNRSQSRSIGTGLIGKNLSNTVYRPLVCIRLKSANIDSIVVPTKFDLYGLQQAAFGYRVILNPTLTDANWTPADTNSSVEYDISATALSGGTVVDQGIFVGSNKGGTASVSGNDVDFSNQLGRTIAGVSDVWCIAAIATTNNDDAVADVTWQEHG